MQNKIKQYREEEGLTQDEYAKMFGISRKTLYEIETGKNNISLELAFKIASHYNLFIEELFVSSHRAARFVDFQIENQRRKTFENWL